MSGIGRICLVGFGEVGQLLAADLPKAGHTELSAWDILFTDGGSATSRALAAFDLTPGRNAADAVKDAGLVISAVTAGETVTAAKAAADGIAKDAWYLDLNSASPSRKQAAAKAISDAGGRYVEAAVMSPVSPKRLATPILLGGPHAETFEPTGHRVGFTGMRFFSADTGKASAAKMCRSVMVKGIEALLTESLLAARHYGVDGTVVDSLSDLFPGPDWEKLSSYMITRSLEHGRRRAEEMREAARTVHDAGIEPLMSAACAARQDWAAAYRDCMAQPDLAAMLDAMLDAMLKQNEGEGKESVPC